MTNNLPSRLKAATCGSRELDALLWCHIKGHTFVSYLHSSRPHGRAIIKYTVEGEPDNKAIFSDFVPHFSTSLDAALALTQELLPDWKVGVCEMWKTPGWKASVLQSEDFKELCRKEGVHDSAPIALILALLTALEADDG